MSVVFLREHVGWKRALGIGLAFGGMVYFSFDPRVFSYVGALVLAILGAGVAAVSLIFLRRLKDVGVFDLQGWIGLFSWPLMLALSLTLESNPIEAVTSASWVVWVILIFTVLVSNLGAHAGLYYILQRYEVSLVSPILLLTPVFAVILGIVLMGDQVSARMATGMTITMIGVAIVTLRQPGYVQEGR